MIIFKSIRYKNFLSTGNNWTTISLNRTKSTLIVGQNGAGKSTILDALSFGLFGKPHRNINKPQLVNTINNKDSIVEVEFIIGKSLFKVVRGIKPQIFEIWKNGEMINQSSHAKEYQKVLEQNIIKLNHKSFHQIVVLGSSSFIPFMQLPAQHRRDVIEDLLDINVFSKMNTLIKEKNSTLKEKLKDNAYQLDILKNKLESQRKYIRDITQINEDEINDKKKKISEVESEIKQLHNSNAECSAFNEANAEEVSKQLKEANNKKQIILQDKANATSEIKTIVGDSKFYEQNDTCPTCSQEIEPDFKKRKIHECKQKALQTKETLERIQFEANDVATLIDEWNNKAEEVKDNNNLINTNNKLISSHQKQIDGLNLDIQRLSSREGDIGEANEELHTMNEERNELMEHKLTLNEEYSYNTVMAEMLKDTGIKTKVIKQYIPVINKLVNQYLQVLDFFVHFNLDESFQETIRSRHRDAFSYDSFSEGEKQRIDLALLFTWRMIAKMKNSVATNLLILDETFDSSLDHDGVDNLMKILHTLDDNTNVFVISHKGEILDGKFEEKLEFKKEKNFSKMVA
jgi:DNA repair exonuclease SbcCD ATPase subunit